jgi:histone H3/H4
MALQEIKKFQKSTELLIPFILFTRLVKEIIYNVFIGRFGYI